jgi:hypothetical protein
VALIGGIRREGRFPAAGVQALVATAVLVLVASSSGGTRVAPLVRALGLALLLASVIGATRNFRGASARASKAAMEQARS